LPAVWLARHGHRYFAGRTGLRAASRAWRHRHPECHLSQRPLHRRIRPRDRARSRSFSASSLMPEVCSTTSVIVNMYWKQGTLTLPKNVPRACCVSMKAAFAPAAGVKAGHRPPV